MRAPKPPARAGEVTLWRYLRLFRQDLLSAQPARLYRAWMAEFRTPFFRSYLCNDPALIAEVLENRPEDFPKSDRVREGLAPLLGQSVFVTNGALWRRQRRIIDPAFAGGRLGDVLPAMVAAGHAAVSRLRAAPAVIEVEAATAHLAADVIFRTLFSVPITDAAAGAVFARFRVYQRAQPLVNPAAFVALPRWVPRWHGRAARQAARAIRAQISGMVADRVRAIAAGTAPDDLATRIMTTPDPETGARFAPAEMADQVAIFFLAGHETSASALAWALYLVAGDGALQQRLADEAAALPRDPGLADVVALRLARDVFRETLRLYPPVPMMVRRARCPVRFRGRDIAPGSQIVLSPWHLHRHERLWDRPDDFDPARWQTAAGRASAHDAYMPFSKGPRICPGAGFAMVEGPLLLALLVRAFRFRRTDAADPVPVAHLTVRARDGIRLTMTERSAPEY